MTDDQQRLGNGWERTVLGATEPIDPEIYAREIGRYRWAAARIPPGARVLELGCASGFGTRLLPGGMHYTGVDYDAGIIAYARAQFGASDRTFVCATIDAFLVIGPRRGQHLAHQLANQAGYDYVWRLDDDCVPEPDVLERLLALMADDVGAVGGAVYEMARIVRGGTSRLEDFFTTGNVQWEPDHGVFPDVDFLYGSFLYRAGLVDYPHQMSPVAFHEETIFTHRLKRAGWRLIADTSIHTHHFKSPHGGTRETDAEWAYAWDHAAFMRILEHEWGVKLIHLGVGLGDNLAFLHVLPELQQRYHRIILGSCYPEVFEGTGVRLIPYDQARAASGENVYDWMAERHWTGHLIEAYRAMYLGAAA